MPSSKIIKKRLPVAPGKNSHFTVRHHGPDWWVFCEGPTGDWIPADDPHQDLVELVNSLKEMEGNPAGGSFSINEHCQVIARTSAPAGYKQNTIYIVGLTNGVVQQYTQTITFEGGTLDPTVTPREGEIWPGPRCGSTYRFAAPGNKKPPTHNLDEVWTEIEGQLDFLSMHIHPAAYPPRSGPLADFLGALRRQLPQGGRFRVNQHGRAFTADQNVFIGIVPMTAWFPAISATD